MIPLRLAPLLPVVPPTITPFAFAAETFAGDGVQVSCYVSRGDLPLTISWTFNGEPIREDQGITTTQLGRNSLLTIESATAEHSGNYTCLAMNRAAVQTYSVPLKVNGTPTRGVLERVPPPDPSTIPFKQGFLSVQSVP